MAILKTLKKSIKLDLKKDTTLNPKKRNKLHFGNLERKGSIIMGRGDPTKKNKNDGSEAIDLIDLSSELGIPPPKDVQLSLRGSQVMTPPTASYSALDVGGEGYMPGIAPEFQYFTNPEPAASQPTPDPSTQGLGSFVDPNIVAGNVQIPRIELSGVGLSYAYGGAIPQSINPYSGRDYSSVPGALMQIAPQYYGNGYGMAEGGMTPPQGMGMDQQQQDLVQLTAAAILGEVDGRDQIIQAFIEQYGPEAFAMLRDQVLREVVPGAQTEGMVEGEGGGQDDRVPGMIGTQRPVAVSPGEYIVPADAVAMAGGGYSGDGAKFFDSLIEDIRRKTTGSPQQAKPYR